MEAFKTTADPGRRTGLWGGLGYSVFTAITLMSSIG